MAPTSPTQSSPTSEATVQTTPNTPAVITVDDIPGAPANSTIASVEQPRNGTATIDGGSVVYTPERGFTGTETITITVVSREGVSEDLDVEIQVGVPQEPVRALNLPSKVGAGTTVLLKRPVLTNAKQFAEARVECKPLLRTKVAGSLGECRVQYSRGSVSVTVLTNEPIGVLLELSAPAKGKYAAYEFEKLYLVR